MKTDPNIPTSDLEADYIQMKVTLYKNLFRYCLVIIAILFLKETVRAVWYGRMASMIMVCIMFISGITLAYLLIKLKDNQELTITFCLGLFYISVLLTQYHSGSGYYELPIETYNMAYAYAAMERIVYSRISKFSHRTCFIICTTTVRAFTVRSSELGLFIMQFVYMCFSIYLDLDRERYDKRFFATYFKNKEQLVKFKNLVVQDIPESIIIINQCLSKPLFVNNSFEQLIKDNTNKDIRTRLQQFELQDSLDVSQESSQDSIAGISKRKQSLLRFLESTVQQVTRNLQTQKFSCNLSYKKTIFRENQDEECNQEYMFEAKVIHLFWDDEPAIAVILHDITQQHTILSLKIADAHKDTVLATVSHELRTPLNGILGMIQIMHKRVNDSEMLKYLSICKNSGVLLLSLVNSILDLNQIRAKKLKLCLERTNVNELLDSIICLFEFQCQQKNLNLKLQIAPTCPKYITTDKNRLSQIFINLVGNALKFTQKGGITISAYGSLSNSGDLIFSVEDTGAGIKDEDKNKLFKVFGKLDQNDRNVNPHGVGLGLTISDKLVKLLGKDGIQLESQYGKGSKFTFAIKKALMNIIEPIDMNSESPRILMDESTDVSRKMKNYSREFIKSSQRSPILNQGFRSNTLINHSLLSLTTQNNRNSLSFTNSLPQPQYRTSQHPLFNQTPRTRCNANSCVLVVDDNPLNIIIAESLIASHGHKAKSALYGQVAIDIILNCNYSLEPIKLIFMDCQMPVMDGYTVTKILKKMMLERRIPEIPIIALTANDSEVDREVSKRAGMCEHISKPLKEAELVRVLNKYMTE